MHQDTRCSRSRCGTEVAQEGNEAGVDVHLPQSNPPQLVHVWLKLPEHLDKVAARKAPPVGIVYWDSHLLQSQGTSSVLVKWGMGRPLKHLMRIQ